MHHHFSESEETRRFFMDAKERKMKVLMLPWVAHGHISPFLELAKRLSKRNHFDIYLCTTPVNIAPTKKLISDEDSLSIQLVELHLPSLPNLPPHYHTTNGLPPYLMHPLRDAFEMSGPAFSNIVETLKPDLLIYDFSVGWAARIVLSRNIPAVQFLTVGAALLVYAFHMRKCPGEKFPFLTFFSEVQKFKVRGGEGGPSEPDKKDEGRFFESFELSSNITLIKTFREIEGKYIDYLGELAQKKMVPVGALVQDKSMQNKDDEHSDIIEWLNKKEPSSVVFVSFGSECFLSKEEMAEVAHGLELSMVNFIWVVRFALGKKVVSLADELPNGFLERVGDRGMIVEGWAPQTRILGHPSTGGFVSHCGWNSVMESMKYGVPIIAMPMHLDQPFNAQVVEEVGFGMNVPGDDNGSLERQKIAEVIRNVVNDTSGEVVRIKARELRERLEQKRDEEIDDVAEELIQLCRKKI